MANFTRNFVAGRMNKVVDQRILPEGEYVDAMNVRMGSTEDSEVGVIENTKGNIALTQLTYIDGTSLSVNARCIGAIDDSANEVFYWLVHDPSFENTASGPNATGKLDLIVSFNIKTNLLTYHVISINDGNDTDTTLNFNPSYLVTGINLIENLLFFTDDYNQPRCIDVTKNYANPVSDIDQFTEESILVIKKPPVESPSVEVITTSGQENFLEDRLISFAYRYEYENGQYSATSQWSDIAFIPKPFEFDVNSMLNVGMQNFGNTAIISYNSGGPLVVGIDLLFKESNSNIIKVIEKIDKATSGLADNTIYQYSFNNSKIFTVLNESEILRLYDNVPLFAKAQTIMGNRLMYGNYIEGYDMIDANGQPVKLEYETNLITEEIGTINIPDETSIGQYTIDTLQNINDSILTFDLDGVELKAGSFISVNLTITHRSFSGTLPFPAEQTDNIELSFDFFLGTDYDSVYEMASSVEFQEAVGTIGTILPVYDPTPGAETSCDGITFTDVVNCALPSNLDGLQKVGSGISAIDQPISIITSPASTEIGFQFCAMKYVDVPSAPTGYVFEYYSVIFADVIFQEIGNPRSLHSNRGYEIGIVYMDDFNRSTTALVSQNNTVHIPCGFSANKNSIQVVIPPEQRAPYWATRYKFVIKPDEENYETIYTNLFFTDPNTNSVWFYLEGENTKKVEVGDRLVVKSDTDGPKDNCAYATVLEKVSQLAGFIEPFDDVTVPGGLYIRINPTSFSAILDPNSVVNLNKQNPDYTNSFGIKVRGDRACAARGGNYAKLNYTVNLKRAAGYDPLNPLWEYEDFSIPAGSIINLKLDWNRSGVGGSCEPRGYLLEKRLTVSADYDNFMDWWNGDNIEQILNTGVSKDGNTELEYIPTVGILNQNNFSIMYLQFYRNPTTNQLLLQLSTGKSCKGVGYPNSRKYCVTADIEVFRAVDLVIFETEPQAALPDVFFENNLSFGIDENGNHLGNAQDQDISTGTPAIIDTGFFNCFAFGNGAESYKIRDSIVGKSFNFGERVTTVAEQDYREASRFADITYSGNYNLESNINRLNEFNKGLSNYKNCEISFGDILILDGRETDVLVLQEDKISYVLAGKNLLSDASAGNVITATPEVLGTQIARPEKYGISFNPESYVRWGYDRYFTDAKRGAVIQLKGNSFQNEQLVVVSEANMRTWFRDVFNESFNTQKLGGFDPYMNEYVLSNNDILLPINPQCLNCGITQTFILSGTPESSDIKQYCVDLGAVVGISEIQWVFTSIEEGATLDVGVEYNSVTTTSGATDENGSIFFDKNEVSVETADITLEATGAMVVSVVVKCVTSEIMTIIEVVITNDSEAGETIHTQYRYTNGDYVGPLLSNLVVFSSGSNTPLVSRYSSTTGPIGTGAFPPDASIMRISTNKIVPDSYNFDTLQDKFRYLRSFILYDNNDSDIQALLNASIVATPNLGASPVFYADFTVPDSTNGEYLYLIWDLRDSLEIELCYSVTYEGACCECEIGSYYVNDAFVSATSIFTDSNLTTHAANGYYTSNGVVRQLVDGVLLPPVDCGGCGVSLCYGISAIDVCCACNTSCETPANTYEVVNPNLTQVTVSHYNSSGVLQETIVDAEQTVYICSIGTPTCDNVFVTITFSACGCGD